MTIAAAITLFVNEKASTNSKFTAQEMRLAVLGKTQKASSPSSSDRILRRLRQQGKVGYTVVDKNNSVYLAVPVPDNSAPTATV